MLQALPQLMPLPRRFAGRLSAPGQPRGLVLELALLALVGLVALAIRLPDYQTVPGFSDEVNEVGRAIPIARGEQYPLTNDDAYNGALWNYLLAAALRVSGNSLVAPRTLVLAFGVLTVLATYGLGRVWSGSRLGGLLAGLLLATAPVHVVVNSRIAWGNSITPLFTTLGSWTLWRATGGQGAGRSLLLAGLGWGLALQTHPSVVALLPGAAVFLVWRLRRRLRTRWPYLAGLLFLLANTNLVLFNLQTGFSSVTVGAGKAAAYTDGAALTPLLYLERLALLGLGLFESLGGAVDLRDDAFDYLLDPSLWPIALVALGGLIWLWRRGNPLPALLVISLALLLPLFNDKYRPIMNGRYLAPLLPLLFAGVGALLAEGWRRLVAAERGPPSELVGVWAREAWLGLLVAFLLAHPWLSLQAFYRQARSAERTNLPLFQALEAIKLQRRADETVVIDLSLRTWRIGWGAGFAGPAFVTALRLEAVPTRVVDLANGGLPPELACASQLVVLPPADSAAQRATVQRLALRRLEMNSMQTASPAFRLYRLEPPSSGVGSCPTASR